MKTTKKIAVIGILSALYVVFSLTLKIPMGIGSIALDLGYIVLTVSVFTVGAYAGIVGGIGAFVESLVFSAYGISWGWVVMNILIGVICGLAISKVKLDSIRKYVVCGLVIIGAVLVGITAKTVIDCSLYSIPYAVKLPKSAVAFGIDSAVMLIGLPIASKVKKLVR